MAHALIAISTKMTSSIDEILRTKSLSNVRPLPTADDLRRTDTAHIVALLQVLAVDEDRAAAENLTEKCINRLTSTECTWLNLRWDDFVALEKLQLKDRRIVDYLSLLGVQRFSDLDAVMQRRDLKEQILTLSRPVFESVLRDRQVTCANTTLLVVIGWLTRNHVRTDDTPRGVVDQKEIDLLDLVDIHNVDANYLRMLTRRIPWFLTYMQSPFVMYKSWSRTSSSTSDQNGQDEMLKWIVNVPVDFLEPLMVSDDESDDDDDDAMSSTAETSTTYCKIIGDDVSGMFESFRVFHRGYEYCAVVEFAPFEETLECTARYSFYAGIHVTLPKKFLPDDVVLDEQDDIDVTGRMMLMINGEFVGEKTVYLGVSDQIVPDQTEWDTTGLFLGAFGDIDDPNFAVIQRDNEEVNWKKYVNMRPNSSNIELDFRFVPSLL